MTWLDWVAYVSGTAFWLLLGWLRYIWVRTSRDMEEAMSTLKVELGEDVDIPEDQIPWTWLVPQDGITAPLHVPADMVGEALNMMQNETLPEKQKMAAEQWRFQTDAQGIRRAMWIAQHQPDIEMALLEWVAHLDLPDKE